MRKCGEIEMFRGRGEGSSAGDYGNIPRGIMVKSRGAEGVWSTEQRGCGPWGVGVEARGVRGMRPEGELKVKSGGN